MSINAIIIVVIVILLLALAGLVLYFVLGNKKDDNLDALMSIHRGNSKQSGDKIREQRNKANDEIHEITEAQRKTYGKKKKQNKTTEEERYYHAGLLSPEDRRKFKRLRIIIPIVLIVIFSLLAFFLLGSKTIIFAVAVGAIFGYIAPSFYLDRLIKKRYDEIMYYLPLVIEQLAIGVSSSLDIGPCLQRVIQMADERDSHNVVTELIYHTERYLKTGVSLEESLTEVGTKSGHPELKHAFIALSQVAKHGGEISHQLQELANAVSSQRETQIEGKIKRLELAATGPVGLVFMAFLSTLGIGIIVKLQQNL